MLKKFKISSILVTYAITAIVVLAVICVIFSFSILSINGNVNNMYDTAVVSQSELKTVQTNLMNIGNNYMLLFVERNFDTVASRLGEIDAWTAEDKEILNAYNESGIEGEYLDSYTALQNALAPYRETRGYMDELLKANDFDGAYHYYITFEAQRETVDDAIAHLCDVNGGLGQILVDQSAKTLKTTFIGIFAIIIILSVILISESVLIVRFIKSELKKSVDLAGSLAEGVIEMPKGLKFEENPRNELVILDNAFYELIENSQKQAETLEGIAAGAIDIEVNVRSGKDTLNLSMEKVVDTLKALQDSLLNMAKAIDAGDSSYRPDADEFSGGYKDIVNGVNKVVDIWDSQVGDLAANIASLGVGRLPDVDTNRAGDFGTLFTQFESTVDSIRSLVQDTQAMANAALAGDYSVRADVDKYQGDYKSVIDGINKTLDMVVDKTNWYSNIIDSFPLPVQVMDVNQNWTLINETFMQILRGAGIAQRADELLGKKCYLSVAEINGVPTLLTKGQNEMQFEWNGGVIKQTTGYIKNTKGETIGYVGSMQNLTAVVREAEYNEAAAMRLQRNLETMARGDFASLEDNNIPTNPFTTAAEGRFNAIDDALDLVIESIRGMIEDSIEMANNAIAGNLDKRAALDRYQGDYQKVMKGLNDTVDALTAPLSEIIDVLESVGEGDLSRKVTGNYSGDLIKSKEAINATTDNLQRIIAEISELLEAIGQGDLTVHAKETYNGDFSAIKKSLEDIEDGLKDVMTGINKSSELVAGGSKQLSEGAQNLAQGSTKQAAAVQQLSSTMKQVADQTKQNTEDARKASEMSTDVMHKAEKGNAQMKDMLQSMADINESSSNISKIIKVIDDIAFQTNILALNAAVEAARAGVHGKGFAVVADEVRNLAAKSAAAASETTALIEGSIANVEAGTKIANETAEALGEIVAGITETSNLCDAIADVSDEQYKGILEVNRGIEDVSKVIQSNSATAEESAASSQELYSQANNLKKLVAQFKLESGSRTLNGPQYASAAAESDERALPEITLDISMGGFDGSDKY